MFGISSTQEATTLNGGTPQMWGEAEIALLSRFCLVDRWTANLHDAMLTLGPDACRLHGLECTSGRFGLLEFVRCYDQRVARDIIGVFEEAAARARPFQYSAELRTDDRSNRIVHCFGDYRPAGSEDEGDELFGIFLFSRGQFSNL